MSLMPASDYLGRIRALGPMQGPEDRAWIRDALAVYVEMIEGRVHFAQAAYRDGEFAWLMDCPQMVGGRTSNAETWDPELGRQLRETLLRPVGQWCVYFAPHNPVRPHADAWLAEHRPPVEWIPDRPFGRASEQGLFRPFWDAIAGRELVVVGPEWLGPPSYLTPWPWDERDHIVVPEQDAWKSADDWARLVCGSVDRGADLFLIAAGSAAPLIIHRAWPEVRDRATLIDIGATLDPYAGVFSRNLTRTEAWQRDIMPLNLP